MKKPISDLKTRGFVALPYPGDLRSAVGTTLEAWKRFCALPTSVKQMLPHTNGNVGVGYELKDGVGNKVDRKENFDVAISGGEWLRGNIAAIKNPAALEFVQQATALVGLIKPTVLEFARQCEAEFGLDGFLDEVESGDDAFFVRFIHYFGDRQPGEETASAHADQSGFTLHLYESAPGLQCLPYDGDWIDMPVSSGDTVIIPSMQMQLRSEGELRALCHRVVATPETARDGRYSAVCFVQLKRTPRYDKDTHGRLQEKPPGFNYQMSHGEFVRLFK